MDYSPVYERFTFVEPKKVDGTHPAAVSHVRKLFSAEECDRILQECLAWNCEPASVYSAFTRGDIDPKVRKGKVYTYSGKNKLWFKPKIDGAIEFFQSQNAPIIINSPSIIEYQLVEYTEPGDHFNVHQDSHISVNQWNMDRPPRKISLTIELTDNTQYEGANLRFIEDDGKTIRPEANKGDAFIFPSWRRHQVKPLVSGVRHALVCWYMGPFWR